MPKITIRENDVSTASTIDVNSNIVYVPGYAITGPVNTPTLCETLEDFQQIFGTKPYTFETSQSFPASFDANAKIVGSYALTNDAEKSYIYAAELLKAGLPVLFERVMKRDIVSKWTASASIPFKTAEGTSDTNVFVIKAKNPGKYGTSISYKIAETSDDKGATVYTVTIAVAENAGIPKIPDETFTVSFDVNHTNYFSKLKSNIVDFSIGNTSGAAASIPTTLKLYESINEGSLTIEGLTNTDYEFSVADMYVMFDDHTAGAESVKSLFDKLTDKGEYQVKFITSGSYPVFEFDNNAITKKMLAVAGTRGDAVALIDHTNNINRVLTGTNSVLESVQKFAAIDTDGDIKEDARKYGAMFTPWATYSLQTLSTEAILPGSFAYLKSLAVSTRSNANWYAVAGVTRGYVPNLLQLSQNVTGAIASAMQPDNAISINPITNIKPYGYCIWGNRTMHHNKDGLVASSFLNIRMLSNDVKKVVYQTAKRLTFELNDNILWLNFKSAIEPTLDQMVSGNGLTGYKIIKKATTKKATIEAIIRLYAVEAVENWDITIELADAYVSVQ